MNYLDLSGNYWWCYAVINGITYSHAPPCSDPNNYVWYPDPDTGGEDDGNGDDGSSGGGGDPDTGPILEEQIAQKNTTFNNNVGVRADNRRTSNPSDNNTDSFNPVKTAIEAVNIAVQKLDSYASKISKVKRHISKSGMIKTATKFVTRVSGALSIALMGT